MSVVLFKALEPEQLGLAQVLLERVSQEAPQERTLREQELLVA